jgi:tol-pal system protein YbgF
VRNDQREIRGQVADLQVALDKLRRQVAVLEGDQQPGARGARAAAAASPDLERRVAVVENRLKLIEQAQPAGAVGQPLPPGVPGEGAPPDAGAAPPAPPFGATPTATPVRATSDSPAARDEAALAGANVDETYRTAFNTMRRGRTGEAIPQFREFLRKNPKSDYADEAQFYIGECYYTQKDYNRSILEFNEVLLKYPKGEKVPLALLRQANAFAELGDRVDARLILQKLVGEYPKTDEAARARELLDQLGE